MYVCMDEDTKEHLEEVYCDSAPLLLLQQTTCHLPACPPRSTLHSLHTVTPRTLELSSNWLTNVLCCVLQLGDGRVWALQCLVWWWRESTPCEMCSKARSRCPTGGSFWMSTTLCHTISGYMQLSTLPCKVYIFMIKYNMYMKQTRSKLHHVG